MSIPEVIFDVFPYKILLHKEWIGIFKSFVYLNHKHTKVLVLACEGCKTPPPPTFGELVGKCRLNYFCR